MNNSHRSVPKTIRDLPPVVGAAEEDGEYPDLRRWLIDFEVEDKTLVGDGPDSEPDLRIFGASVGRGRESPHVTEGLVDAGGRTVHRSRRVVAECLVGLNQMFLDQVEVAGDVGRAADPIATHALSACAPASRLSPPHPRRD